MYVKPIGSKNFCEILTLKMFLRQLRKKLEKKNKKKYRPNFSVLFVISYSTLIFSKSIFFKVSDICTLVYEHFWQFFLFFFIKNAFVKIFHFFWRCARQLKYNCAWCTHIDIFLKTCLNSPYVLSKKISILFDNVKRSSGPEFVSWKFFAKKHVCS